MGARAIEETTAHSLARTCRLLRARAHALLEEVGLYQGQQFVLCALWGREGPTHSELAERLHVRPPTITNALKRMEKAGFVARRPDEQDQRVSRVYLTDAGRSIQDAVETVWCDLEEQAFAGFTPEEHALLEESLLRIQQNLMQTPTDVGS